MGTAGRRSAGMEGVEHPDAEVVSRVRGAYTNVSVRTGIKGAILMSMLVMMLSKLLMLVSSTGIAARGWHIHSCDCL